MVEPLKQLLATNILDGQNRLTRRNQSESEASPLQSPVRNNPPESADHDTMGPMDHYGLIDLLQFGLPSCLWVPIAVKSRDALEESVGPVAQIKTSRAGRINAMLVHPRHHPIIRTPGVPLWALPEADDIEARLHPAAQVWVHVDYRTTQPEEGVRFAQKRHESRSRSDLPLG